MKIAAIAALSIFLAASGLSVQAQQMPSELVGVWAPDEVSCDLPNDDVDGEFPYLIVATNGYAGHEVTCRLASAGPPIRRGSQTAFRLKFRCEGEGMAWRASEVWTVTSVRRRHGGWVLSQQRLNREGVSYRRCGGGGTWRMTLGAIGTDRYPAHPGLTHRRPSQHTYSRSPMGHWFSIRPRQRGKTQFL